MTATGLAICARQIASSTIRATASPKPGMTIPSLAMAHTAHARITEVDAPHLSMISNPGTVTNVILQAAQATS